MAENESQGISRRDLLKRGAALGGAVVWATPVVQTLGMGRAFAQTASPPDISYIALVLACEGSAKWLVKFEVDEGQFEQDPGTMEECSQELSMSGATPADGDRWLTATPSGSCWVIDLKNKGDLDTSDLPCAVDTSEADWYQTLEDTLTVQAGKVKGGLECESVTGGSFPIQVCL